MGLTAKLAVFNGTVVGTIFGLAAYLFLAEPQGLAVLIEVYEIVVFSFAAAASGNVLALVKFFPTAPVIAGGLSGFLGGVLAWFVPSYLSVALTLPVGAIGGFVAALVVGLMLRFLPGL